MFVSGNKPNFVMKSRKEGVRGREKLVCVGDRVGTFQASFTIPRTPRDNDSKMMKTLGIKIKLNVS